MPEAHLIITDNLNAWQLAKDSLFFKKREREMNYSGGGEESTPYDSTDRQIV